MSTTAERVRELVAPIVEELGATVYDVEHTGGVLRVSLQRAEGLDLSVLTEATRRISAALDAADPLPGRYTLEVSTPGLERALRTDAHFADAVGERVKLKLRAGAEGDRRVEGELVAAGEGSVTVRTDDGVDRRLAIADLERANTHVDWSPPPKPGSPGGGGSGKNPSKKHMTPAPDASSATTPESPTPQSEATS